jgi:hypothetical protein
MIEAANRRIVDIDVMISGSTEPTKENIAQNPMRVDTIGLTSSTLQPSRIDYRSL